VGVIKAGWFCGSTPSGAGCGHNCDPCFECVGECHCKEVTGDDPRLIDIQKGDCKKLTCVNGFQFQANDNDDEPEDEECKMCEDGELVDKDEEAKPFSLSSISVTKVAPSADSMNQLVINPCRAGMVAAESLLIEIGVRCEGGYFKAELLSLEGKFSSQARLLPGQRELTGVADSTEENYCDQVTELAAGGFCPGKWALIELVRQHERVHESRLKPALEKVASSIEAEVVTMLVPATIGKTKADAIAEIKALYVDMFGFFKLAWAEEAYFLFKDDHGDNYDGPAYQAGNAYIKQTGLVSEICAHAQTNNWKQCGVCP
jgi:hypothetical protein